MKKKELPSGVRALLAFISVLLCLVLFVTSVALILVTDVRVVTSKDGLKTIITQALFPSLEKPMYSPLAGGMPDLGNLGNGDFQSTLIDSIYDLIEEQMGEELPVSREDVAQFVSQSTLPDFLADKTAGIVNDIYNGELTTTITTEEVIGLIQDNKQLIEETLDITIPEKELGEALGYVEEWMEENDFTEAIQEQVSQITGLELPAKPDTPANPNAPANPEDDASGGLQRPGSAKPNGSQLISGLLSGEVDMSQLKVAEILAMVRSITSQTVQLLLIGICVLLLGLLMLTHWGRPFAAVRSAGIPIMIAGIFMSLPAFLGNFLLGSMTGEAVTAGIILQQVLNMTRNVSLFFTIGGLVLIVAGAILNSVMNKRRRAVPAVAVAPAAPAVPEVVSVPETAAEDLIVAVEAAEEAPEAPVEEPQEVE